MKSLTVRALGGFGVRLFFMGYGVFGPAHTWAYWQGWLFVATYGLSESLIIGWLRRHDPALLERRLKGGVAAEKRPAQKVVMALVSFGFGLMLVIPSLDHRLHWSHVPAAFSLLAAAALLVGQWVIYRTFRENTFAAIVVDVIPGQRVIATGPYARVRHPMYSGVFLGYLAFPVLLGSWWGLLGSAVLGAVFIARIFDEEKLLRQSLPGYEEYCRKVPWRLVPRGW